MAAVSVVLAAAAAVPSGAAPASPLEASGAVPTVPPAGGDRPTCWFGACYDYVFGRQVTAVQGAAVSMGVARPRVDPRRATEHSLQELSIQNTGQTATVEVGWTVDRQLNHDTRPHLFVYHWVHGKTSCYNGCGFVRTSNRVRPGRALRPGSTVRLGIRRIRGDWWVLAGGRRIGYFPGSLWQGTFTSGSITTAFGEVALAKDDVPSCTAMGNGRFGTAAGSSRISAFTLYGTSTPPRLSLTSTSPARYNSGHPSARSFTLGGPGKGPC
ncbi:hypothetical protein BIV57_17135 [Mangrovactinospora gilvigrisea]|uniref:Neprosin PEP catalytic domain-containing protein n=1 Tax=Mangrovactinospora gilvigrisea TaxID=1428644 RepID=A0A1J7BC86_9ACTN|nr:hypothetical protein BIV57_17135 [Mangrovactinospora gilvigrisea]